jgi:hypothetical protein
MWDWEETRDWKAVWKDGLEADLERMYEMSACIDGWFYEHIAC